MSTFNYTKDLPIESTFNDIQSLNKFTETQFHQLISTSVAVLSDPHSSSLLLTRLEEFCDEHSVSFNGLKTVVRTLLSVLKSALRLNLDASKIRDDFIALGLNEDRAMHLSQLWQGNQSAMWRGALSETLMVNRLVDMDWKFGVTAASSELNKVGNTFLQLKLVIDKGLGTENIYMELTLPQFYLFLHEMEKAKSVMEYLA